MIKSRKGAEIALNVIIVAVIALLVLVVVIFIFAGRTTIFSKGVSNCESLGGTCENDPCLTLTPPRAGIPSGDCVVSQGASPKYCCSTVGK